MEGEPVELYLYDLSGGLAKQLSPMIIGTQIEWIPHTSVMVFGREYYFGGGICVSEPLDTPYGSPVKSIPMGTTFLSREDFEAFLGDISSRFTMATYNLFQHNCNHFSSECTEFLVGKQIPGEILHLPQQVLSTPMGQSLMQMMGGAFDPRTLEGTNNPQQMSFQQQAQNSNSK